MGKAGKNHGRDGGWKSKFLEKSGTSFLDGPSYRAHYSDALAPFKQWLEHFLVRLLCQHQQCPVLGRSARVYTAWLEPLGRAWGRAGAAIPGR